MTVTCAVCRKPFQRFPSSRQTCCSRTCGYQRQSRRKRGHMPIKANQARLAIQRERSRAALQREFGDLSVREIAIIRRVYWKAYNIGYQRALSREPRKVAA